MEHEDILKLKYYVMNGQAFNGSFDTRQQGKLGPHMADYATNIDALLTNARNLYLTVDTVVYLLLAILADESSDKLDCALLSRVRAFTDVARVGCAAAQGDPVFPQLLHPVDYFSLIGMPELTEIAETIIAIIDTEASNDTNNTPVGTPITDTFLNNTADEIAIKMRYDDVDTTNVVDLSVQRRKWRNNSEDNSDNSA